MSKKRSVWDSRNPNKAKENRDLAKKIKDTKKETTTNKSTRSEHRFEQSSTNKEPEQRSVWDSRNPDKAKENRDYARSTQKETTSNKTTNNERNYEQTTTNKEPKQRSIWDSRNPDKAKENRDYARSTQKETTSNKTTNNERSHEQTTNNKRYEITSKQPTKPNKEIVSNKSDYEIIQDIKAKQKQQILEQKNKEGFQGIKKEDLPKELPKTGGDEFRISITADDLLEDALMVGRGIIDSANIYYVEELISEYAKFTDDATPMYQFLEKYSEIFYNYEFSFLNSIELDELAENLGKIAKIVEVTNVVNKLTNDDIPNIEKAELAAEYGYEQLAGALLDATPIINIVIHIPVIGNIIEGQLIEGGKFIGDVGGDIFYNLAEKFSNAIGLTDAILNYNKKLAQDIKGIDEDIRRVEELVRKPKYFYRNSTSFSTPFILPKRLPDTGASIKIEDTLKPKSNKVLNISQELSDMCGGLC